MAGMSKRALAVAAVGLCTGALATTSTAAAEEEPTGSESGSIRGSVTFADGEPVNSFCITDFDAPTYTSYYGDAGAFEIPAIEAGEHRLAFDDCGDGEQSPEPIAGLNDYAIGSTPFTRVSVTQGETTDVDVVLQRSGEISGRVIKDTGEPFRDACVVAYGWDDDYRSTYVWSGESGDYLLRDVAPGLYWVDFGDCSIGDGVYESQVWPYKSLIDEAEPVLVGAGRTTAGIDAKLALSLRSVEGKEHSEPCLTAKRRLEKRTHRVVKLKRLLRSPTVPHKALLEAALDRAKRRLQHTKVQVGTRC